MDKAAKEYSSLSPYSYAANNPLIFIDPDGERIVLIGTEQEKQVMLTNLQKLTNDKLSIRADGTVIIKKMGGENTDKYLKIGSELISVCP